MNLGGEYWTFIITSACKKKVIFSFRVFINSNSLINNEIIYELIYLWVFKIWNNSVKFKEEISVFGIYLLASSELSQSNVSA